jgi:hypothetical protein
MSRLREFLYKIEGVPVQLTDGGNGFGPSCRHDGVDDGATICINWVFVCNDVELFGWRMPGEVIQIFYERRRSGLSIAYITSETIDNRG